MNSQQPWLKTQGVSIQQGPKGPTEPQIGGVHVLIGQQAMGLHGDGQEGANGPQGDEMQGSQGEGQQALGLQGDGQNEVEVLQGDKQHSAGLQDGGEHGSQGVGHQIIALVDGPQGEQQLRFDIVKFHGKFKSKS